MDEVVRGKPFRKKVAFEWIGERIVNVFFLTSPLISTSPPLLPWWVSAHLWIESKQGGNTEDRGRFTVYCWNERMKSRFPLLVYSFPGPHFLLLQVNACTGLILSCTREERRTIGSLFQSLRVMKEWSKLLSLVNCFLSPWLCCCFGERQHRSPLSQSSWIITFTTAKSRIMARCGETKRRFTRPWGGTCPPKHVTPRLR